ncbi:MAG: hypothetical protein AB7H48_05105 [Parachlamydiales bacterium]
MQKEHQALIDQYKKNEKVLERSRKKTVVLEVLMIGIVCYMKSIQETASLKANIIATSLVTALLCLHFLDFYPRRSRYKNVADTVLEGVNLENHYSFLKPQFFKSYLEEFNTLGFIAKMALFDLFFIYFFSVSYTQLLKAINPEAVVRLKFITPISTWVITLYIGWAYYKSIRPLSRLKREIEV